MPATVEALDNPFIYRTTFTDEDVSIKTRRKNERRFVPSALVPHTININTAPGACSLQFDYTIDETAETKNTISDRIELVRGKYTKKVLQISFSFTEPVQLPALFLEAKEYLSKLETNFDRESLRRNYRLVGLNLGSLADYFKNDAEFRSYFEP